MVHTIEHANTITSLCPRIGDFLFGFLEFDFLLFFIIAEVHFSTLIKLMERVDVEVRVMQPYSFFMTASVAFTIMRKESENNRL